MDNVISNIEMVTSENDYQHELIKNISEQTNLSREALYTRLRIIDKITYNDYKIVLEGFKNEYRDIEEKLKKVREKEKLEGRAIQPRPAKPILSPLYVNTVQSAFIEGIIGESEFCRRLNVKPENIDKYLK